MGSSRTWGGIFLVLAIAYGLPSFLYPYGGDAAMFDYVARSWLSGAWPYADVVDHKPPPIYALHAVIIGLLGPHHAWVIRVLEMAAILLMGTWISRIFQTEDHRFEWVSPGLAALLLASVYYTGFDYWNSGQTEIWVAFFLTGSWFFASRVEHSAGSRMLCSGLMAGAAFLFKFPAVIPSVGIACLYGWFSLERTSVDAGPGSAKPLRGFVHSVAIFALAAAAGVIASFVPFLISGRMNATWEVLFLFNRFYAPVVHAHLSAPFLLFNELGVHSLISFTVFALGAGRAALARDARAGRLAMISLVLFVLSVASVLVQGKLYPYHWAVVSPALVAMLLWGLGACFRGNTSRLNAAVVAIVAVTFVFSARNPTELCSTIACEQARGAWRYLSGTDDRSEYLERFDHHHGVRNTEQLGMSVSRLSSPGDSLCVLGAFAPSAYFDAELLCPSRFFSSLHTSVIAGDSGRAGVLVDWIEENRAALQAAPPTFVVTSLRGKRSVETLVGQRYETIERAGDLQLMVRRDAPKPDAGRGQRRGDDASPRQPH